MMVTVRMVVVKIMIVDVFIMVVVMVVMGSLFQKVRFQDTPDKNIRMLAADAAFNTVFDLPLHLIDPDMIEPVDHHLLLISGQKIQKSRRQHITGRPHLTVEI